MAESAAHSPAGAPLSESDADALARAIRAFGSAKRLRIVWALLEAERTVDQLATELGIEQSALSHELRVLREARVVSVRRVGRYAHYQLHDHHIPALVAALRHHQEHVSEST